MASGSDFPEGGVDEDREEQHGAEEEFKPVGVPASVHDALVGHAEDEGADSGADGGAAAAGEGAAADHCGDDVEEFVADTVAGLDGVEGEEGVHAYEPGGEADEHEEGDFDPTDWYADGSGGFLVAADGEDPVAEFGFEQQD